MDFWKREAQEMATLARIEKRCPWYVRLWEQVLAGWSTSEGTNGRGPGA
jgi:hypothetical protein